MCIFTWKQPVTIFRIVSVSKASHWSLTIQCTGWTTDPEDKYVLSSYFWVYLRANGAQSWNWNWKLKLVGKNVGDIETSMQDNPTIEIFLNLNGKKMHRQYRRHLEISRGKMTRLFVLNKCAIPGWNDTGQFVQDKKHSYKHPAVDASSAGFRSYFLHRDCNQPQMFLKNKSRNNFLLVKVLESDSFS